MIKRKEEGNLFASRGAGPSCGDPVESSHSLLLASTSSLTEHEDDLRAQATVTSSESTRERTRARDHLANERTYLSWVRTGLALCGASIGLLKWDDISNVTAFMVAVLGLVVLVTSTRRYFQVMRMIERGQFEPHIGGTLSVVALALVAIVATFILHESDLLYKESEQRQLPEPAADTTLKSTRILSSLAPIYTLTSPQGLPGPANVPHDQTRPFTETQQRSQRRRLEQTNARGKKKREEDTEEAEAESESDDADQFLYGEEGYPVIDYHSDGSVDPMHPDFLFSPNNGPRMVEFYAVWCPHCQHFRDHYIQIAKQVQTIVKDQSLVEIKVYAVACNLYKDICQHFDIKGFPQIKLFKANSTEVAASINYWEIHAFDVLTQLGIQPTLKDIKGKLDSVEHKEATPDKDGKPANLRQKVGQKVGQEPAVLHHRTKEDVFNDAYLSFDFNLRNGIFMSKGALSNKTAGIFHDWLELLRRSMPPTWRIQPVLTELLKQFDRIKQSNNDLVEVLDMFPPPPKKKWSDACSKGVKGAGYTCGLWQLFHIMTVGVVEWNLMIYDGDHLILSTEESSRRLRDFIENFFACNVCRTHFVQAYDACSLDRCHRLREPDDPDAENTQEEFIEFPLWLYEAHNAVNLRLMKERAEREKKTWDHGDEIGSQWPSRRLCPRCWREDNAWDTIMVYKFLRTEYWPDDAVADLYRTKLNEPIEVFTDDDSTSSPLEFASSMLVALPVAVLAVLAVVWFVKKQERRRSGRHKREE